MNNEFAPDNSGGNLPSWADPDVPFLSRKAAEDMLKARGSKNGDFVTRQTTNAPHCYVITSCNGGAVHNSQIKYENGLYVYGAKPVGGSLAEVITVLKTTVKISPPSGGEPYNLKDHTSDAGYLTLNSDA